MQRSDDMQSITTVELRALALMDCIQWSRHRLECLMACMPYAHTVSASTLPFSDLHRSAAASGPLSWHRHCANPERNRILERRPVVRIQDLVRGPLRSSSFNRGPTRHLLADYLPTCCRASHHGSPGPAHTTHIQATKARRA